MTSPEQPLDWAPRSTPLGAPAAPVDGAAAYPPTYGPPPTPPKRRRTGLIVGLVAAVLLLAGGGTVIALALRGGTPAPTPSTCHTVGITGCEDHQAGAIDITGTLVLAESRGVLNIDDIACRGMQGYDDIHDGTEVTVTDQDGKVIGVGSLDVGHLVGRGLTRTCEFPFRVLNIPAGKTFYAIGVGRRGSLHYTESQIRGAVNLQLGG